MTACPEGITGLTQRLCGGSFQLPARWETPDLSNCVSKWALEIKDKAIDPKESALSVAEQTAALTDVERADRIYPGDLKAMVDVIGTLSHRETQRAKADNTEDVTQFTKSIVSTASNLLDSQTIGKWVFIPEMARKSETESLINSIDSVALQMARSGTLGRTATTNVVLEALSTSNQSTLDDLVIGEKNDQDQAMAIFPSSELNQGADPQYFTYVSFDTMGSLLTPGVMKNESVNTAVVSLTMSNPKRRVLVDPLVIIFSNKQSGEMSGSACVFWNMSRDAGDWSTEGCYVNTTNSSHTVCHCYHLTSFAVLMSVKGDKSALIAGRHQIALNLITYIGVVLSVAALCLTFVTFLTFRFLKSSRTFIHTNLALALIIAQLLFLFGINKTKTKLVCQIIAGTLHYIWLASFVWMALEGVMLYLMLVKVFGTRTITKTKRTAFLTIGWCSPLIVVAVSAGVYPAGYGTEYYCWLSVDRGFIWAFVGPALLVIAFNFVIMGVTFSVMARRQGHRRKPNKIRKIRYWAKACTLLTCILGLTWLFGVFYINHETIFMAYFFTIFNSLQGVFIFFFHCIGDEKIRREYIRIMCCRDKGPVYTKASKYQNSSADKMLKTVDNRDSKNLNYTTGSTGTTNSSDSQKAVLVMYQKRSSYGPRGSVNQDDVENNDHNSQRTSGEIIVNPRDSLGSYASFKLQTRNSARYSAMSRESATDAHDQQSEPKPMGELCVVHEDPSNPTQHTTTAEASNA